MTSLTNIKPLIAVLDDEPTICDVIEELLTDEGYRVTCYTQSSDFINGLVHQIPDVLILDLRFRGQTLGCDTLAELRNRPATSTLPVILSTTYPQSVQLHTEQVHTPNTVFLEKPFEINELLDMVRLALRGGLGAQG